MNLYRTAARTKAIVQRAIKTSSLSMNRSENVASTLARTHCQTMWQASLRDWPFIAFCFEENTQATFHRKDWLQEACRDGAWQPEGSDESYWMQLAGNVIAPARSSRCDLKSLFSLKASSFKIKIHRWDVLEELRRVDIKQRWIIWRFHNKPFCE